jgi:hypothetical protein
MTSFEPQRALQTANAPGISHLSNPLRRRMTLGWSRGDAVFV